MLGQPFRSSFGRRNEPIAVATEELNLAHAEGG